MVFAITDEEVKQAKWPHELFLINLITNHILIFVALLGMANQFPAGMLVTPTISFLVLGYVLIGSAKAKKNASWYVKCHWELAAARSRFFIMMLGIVLAIVAVLLIMVGFETQELKPGHFAVMGVTMLPTLVTILALIVMESDASHKAKNGIVPKWLLEKYPPPADIEIKEGDEPQAATDTETAG